MFAEGNDVERHLDRPPGTSPFQTGWSRFSAEQGSSENSRVSQRAEGLWGVARSIKAPFKQLEQGISASHLRLRFKKEKP